MEPATKTYFSDKELDDVSLKQHASTSIGKVVVEVYPAGDDRFRLKFEGLAKTPLMLICHRSWLNHLIVLVTLGQEKLMEQNPP